MFVWVAKFGAAYGVRTGIHVGVDVVVNQIKPPWRKRIVMFGLLGGAFFTAVIGTMGAKFVYRAVLSPTRYRPTSRYRAGSSISASRSAPI